MIQYPPVTVTSGNTSTANINAYPDTQAVVIYNESPYFLSVTFVGSGTLSIPAYTADVYPIAGNFSGTIQIMPSTYLNTTNSNPPSSVVYIQSYGSNDLLTKNVKNNVSTGYPLALVRQVSSDVSNATNLTNVGYPVGQTIVFGQPVGDTGSPTSLSNNGVLDLGDAKNDALIYLTGTLGYLTFMHSNALGVQDASSNLVFSYDQHGNVICANGQTTITYGGSNETHILNNQGSDIAFYTGATPTQIGRITNGGTFKFGNGSQGSITAISKFGSYGITNVMTYYNHNLGVVPDVILLQLVGNNQGTCTYDDGTLTSTQVKIAGSLSTGLFVRGLAIKF